MLGKPYANAKIAEAFNARETIGRMISAMKVIKRELAEHTEYESKSITSGFEDAARTNTPERAIKSAISSLRDAQPFAHCPDCHGARFIDGETCTPCGSRGWVTKRSHHLLVGDEAHKAMINQSQRRSKQGGST